MECCIITELGIIVFGLQPSRDYPALKEKSKRALKDRYAVEVIRVSDTGYRVSAKTTPTNLLHNVRSPLHAQNIGMT